MNIDFETSAIIFSLLGMLAIILIWKSLHKIQLSADNGYDWKDLLMENGRASKAAHVLLGAYVVTTWQFIYYTLNGKMSEAYFGLYAAAWIAPAVMRLIFNPNAPATIQTPQTKTTTTTETETK